MSATPSPGHGELAGQVAMVTGGGAGDWSRYCPRTRLCGRSGCRNGALDRPISRHGGRYRRPGGAVAVQADVTDARVVQHLVAETERQFGPVGSAGEQCGERQYHRSPLGSGPGGLVVRCHRESAQGRCSVRMPSCRGCWPVAVAVSSMWRVSLASPQGRGPRHRPMPLAIAAVRRGCSFSPRTWRPRPGSMVSPFLRWVRALCGRP